MAVRRSPLFQQGKQATQQLRYAQWIPEYAQHRMPAQVIRRPLLVVQQEVVQKGLITSGQRAPFREDSVIGHLVIAILFFQ